MTVNEQWFAASSAGHLEEVAALAEDAVEGAERKVEKAKADLDAAREARDEARDEAKRARSEAKQARKAAGDEDVDGPGGEQVTAQADAAEMKTEI